MGYKSIKLSDFKRKELVLVAVLLDILLTVLATVCTLYLALQVRLSGIIYTLHEFLNLILFLPILSACIHAKMVIDVKINIV